jgi:hypothetical protein
MNSCLKYFSASLLALLTQAAFAQVPQLGGAASFAVLSAAPDGGGAVTCTDSTIDGDVGSSGARASVVTTRCKISGATIAPVSAGVLADFNGAYAALAPKDGDVCPVITGTLAGVTLTPGVYCISDVAKTGVLTLDGSSNDIWIFKVIQTADGALTGTNFSVVMDNDGDACNVTWWVPEAATMTDSDFKGTILAGAAITVTGTAGVPPTPFEGRALAKAAVTLTDVAFIGCVGGSRGGRSQSKCNQGVGNGPEACDPGNSNQDGHGSNPFVGAPNTNDELGGTPGNPGRKGGNIK